ncbi:MAG: RdgB/HAM1 family non-canonical purine NTP pyrophosphatase [Acidimicrobiia bacterium]
MIPRLVLATKNRDKLREMEAVLAGTGLVGEVVQGLDWPDVEETGDTLEANALHKARVVVEATGLPAIADDTGLEVFALGGGPGVHTARLAGPNATYDQNVALLLNLLTGVSDRSARFRSVVALVFPDGSEISAEGVLFGAITPEPRGSGGFGYDPVFLVGDQTLAEMGQSSKNLMSHRAMALRALARELGLPVP